MYGNNLPERILRLILDRIRHHFIIHGQADIILQGSSFEESNRMISSDPEKFKELVRESLRRQVKAINITL